MIASVRVAAHDFTVICMDAREGIERHAHGQCVPDNLVIRIDVSAPLSLQLDTLLHEIGHAIYWAYGVEDEDKEERIVSIFGTAWAQVYRDNPDLLQWVSKATQALKDCKP